ncbi:MAG: AbrB/MazE/SpoVT family DNA-binding domain-containing protein [Thermoplasmata archaeon]
MAAEKAHSVVATVSKGGRLRIPQEVIDRLDLKDGKQIVFFLTANRTAALVATGDSAISAPRWP